MDHAEVTEVPAERRPFRLGDAIALVAAIALGLASWRGMLGPQDPGRSFGLLVILEVSWISLPIALSLALLPGQLARREDRRRMRRGAPGLLVHVIVAACLARIAALLIFSELALVIDDGYTAREAWDRLSSGLPTLIRSELRNTPGIGVASCWFALAMVGKWRPERSWDDRLGRALGILWMTALLEPVIWPVLRSLNIFDPSI